MHCPRAYVSDYLRGELLQGVKLGRVGAPNRTTKPASSTNVSRHYSWVQLHCPFLSRKQELRRSGRRQSRGSNGKLQARTSPPRQNPLESYAKLLRTGQSWGPDPFSSEEAEDL